MTEKNPTWVAGATFRNAMSLAIDLHAGQARKKDQEPYLGHLLGVASNVIEAGGNENQAAAALLHDAIEDCGATEDTITAAVGSEVFDLVNKCTEPSFAEDGLSRADTWPDRKNHYLRHLADMAPDDESVLVALADKVNNCEKSARDLHRHLHHEGKSIESFWGQFNAGDSCQQWWYTSLLQGFRAKPQVHSYLARPLLQRFEHAVAGLFEGREILTCTVRHAHAPNHPEVK